MNKKNLTELHQLASSELSKKLGQLKIELAKAVMESQAGKLKNTRSCSSLRDQIARVMTVMREKSLESGKV